MATYALVPKLNRHLHTPLDASTEIARGTALLDTVIITPRIPARAGATASLCSAAC